MAQVCFACQTTSRNNAHVCPTCGRNLSELGRVWARGRAAWHGYLEQTGWYPGRRDAWVEEREVLLTVEPAAPSRPPSRVVAHYLGGHPRLSSTGRVILTRDASQVSMSWPGWWPARPPRIVIPISSVRSVSCQRTCETTLDEAVMTAAIGGARTGPLGVALGTAIGRRRRVVRTVHVDHDCGDERLELVFRAREDQGEVGISALVRIFRSSHER